MAINSDLLKILVCPETKLPVALAPQQLVRDMNARIETQKLRNRAGAPVSEKIDGALLRSDGKVLYPIREDIPVMLVDEGIELPLP